MFHSIEKPQKHKTLLAYAGNAQQILHNIALEIQHVFEERFKQPKTYDQSRRNKMLDI